VHQKGRRSQLTGKKALPSRQNGEEAAALFKSDKPAVQSAKFENYSISTGTCTASVPLLLLHGITKFSFQL